ncbi:hypothetical protein [Pedobacter sp. SYSU D00535]|uniref:hypothetical protein n=1 Tax=Pedobacter sp. SYSU D00535 TaxID=2810308 RepID=UPI001A9729EA|nr:hypothetical protein [Pedobacter sp. SYSU D00535]
MEATVEVFRTNVESQEQAQLLTNLLLRHLPDSAVNFDLEDCDKILRVEAMDVPTKEVERLLAMKGFSCQVLDY